MEVSRSFIRSLAAAIVLACIGSSQADGIGIEVPTHARPSDPHPESLRLHSPPLAAQRDPVGAPLGAMPDPDRQKHRAQGRSHSRGTVRSVEDARVQSPPVAAVAMNAGGQRDAPDRSASRREAPSGARQGAAAPAIRATGGKGPRRLRANADFVPVPLQGSIDRVQPMTGIVLWNDNVADLNALGADVQLEFAYLKYSDVVNDQDVYDWSAVDARLASAAARGHQMILRFHDTYPGQTRISIPAYVANSPGYELTYRSVEGRQTFIPDWRSALLQRFVLEFYTRFAQRYDQDPRLAFLQAGFGSYAEYHLWDGPLALGQTFPSKAFQQQFLEHMGATFDQTPWSLSIDAASSTYSPFSAVPALRQLRFGLFDDSFMHESHSGDDQEYNRWAWLFFGEQRHHDSPAGGEFNYYSDFDQRHVLDYPDGPYGRSFESFAAQYRITYMIGNDQPRYQTRARIRQAAMATGYAFRITGLASNGECVRMAIRNEGIAPIYHDAWPAANGQRADASLRGLLPGSEETFEACIGPHSPGALEIGIESDRLVPGQRIQFNADLP